MTSTDFDEMFRVFARDAIPTLSTGIFPNNENFRLTAADKLSILVGFCGVVPEDESLLGKTLALGFEDELTGRIVYQTAPVMKFHYSPFKILGTDDKKRGTLVYEVPKELQIEFGKTLEWGVMFGGNFLRQRSHHFTLSDREGNLLPAALLVNPKTDGCDEMCKGCSRVAMNAFSPANCDYINENARTVQVDFAKNFPGADKSELKYLNVMTGCQPDSKEEYGMFLRTTRTYKEFGFDPVFFFFTNLIDDPEQMSTLASEGALGYGSTLETINDEIRLRNWGQKKGGKTFREHLARLERIKEHFQIAEVGMVFGQDDFAELSEGIQTLGENEITIAGNVQRCYNMAQVRGVHPSVWEKGLAYFTDAFEQNIASNARLLSSARYIRERGLECLAKKLGRSVEDHELPYKYRG